MITDPFWHIWGNRTYGKASPTYGALLWAPMIKTTMSKAFEKQTKKLLSIIGNTKRTSNIDYLNKELTLLKFPDLL